MADNVTANAGSGGSVFATANLTWSGDTANIPIGSGVILTGSEGSWTANLMVGGAGSVAAGVQRVTLASDDPAVASLQTLDNAISGNEMQVDVVGALPAGTNAIGKLAANSGVDIGDVDVTSIAAGDNNIGNVDIVTVPADPFGVNADAASATGSISAKLRFIASTGIPITGTVTVGSHAVTNAGTFAVQVDGNALTALQLIDDCIYADDGAWTGDSSKHALVGGIYQSSPQTITDGRTAPIQLTQNGYQIVSVNGTLTVASHAVTNAGTFAVQVDGTALTRLTDIETNTDSLAVVGNGSAATAIRVTVANDSTGVLATVSTVTTLTGSSIAHDSADSGNPHKIGAKATTSLSSKTMVANNDRTDLFAGVDGVQIVRTHCNLEDQLQDRATNTDGASTDFAGGMAAPGADTFLRVTKITIANSSASFCTVDFRNGAAGAVIWTSPVPATGGITEVFDPPLKVPSANTALAYDASAATSTLTISVVGFKSKV